MAEHDMTSLWDRWVELWNGDLEQGEAIVHPEFELHRIPAPHIPDSPGGREYLIAWVGQTRSFFDDLRFTAEVGPIVDGDMVAGRWVAEGDYQGGIPGSTAPAGTRVRFHGNDIWRAEGGQVREYWLSDDLLDLATQLGVIPPA
jgi:predicted ester cyclase